MSLLIKVEFYLYKNIDNNNKGNHEDTNTNQQRWRRFKRHGSLLIIGVRISVGIMRSISVKIWKG